LLEVLGKASVSSEPCECAFDDPAARQHFEALGGIGPFDDFDYPLALADLGQCLPELVSSIATIGEHVPQPWEATDNFSQHERCAITVLDVCPSSEHLAQLAT
jgi:hypothetical protein